MRLKIFALLAVLALVAAACGSETNDAATPEAPNAGAEVLPPNSDPGTTPPDVAGACLEGEPDCNDTLLPGQEPTDLPPSDAGGPTSAGALVDGGLTVTEALASDATGTIAVKGLLLVDEQGARLCEGFAESAPPLCSFAEVPITGYEEVLSVPLTSSQGVSWTDQVVSFLGEIIDGTFVVDPTAG